MKDSASRMVASSGAPTWRDAIAPDEFEGVSQLAETPGDWAEDMRTTYRRTA